MRIMLDTNVLLSALLFPGERMNRMMQYIFEAHRLVLSSFVIDELFFVVRRKFPAKESEQNSPKTGCPARLLRLRERKREHGRLK